MSVPRVICDVLNEGSNTCKLDEFKYEENELSDDTKYHTYYQNPGLGSSAISLVDLMNCHKERQEESEKVNHEKLKKEWISFSVLQFNDIGRGRTQEYIRSILKILDQQTQMKVTELLHLLVVFSVIAEEELQLVAHNCDQKVGVAMLDVVSLDVLFLFCNLLGILLGLVQLVDDYIL